MPPPTGRAVLARTPRDVPARPRAPRSNAGVEAVNPVWSRIAQSPSAPQRTGRISRVPENDEPTTGFTCTLMEMAADEFDETRSCCAENILERLRRMHGQALEALRLAVSRMASGAAMDGLLTRHFGPSGPSRRATVLANLRTTLTTAEGFLRSHTFQCRPLADRFGCTGTENARAGTDTDITVCMGGGEPTFEWPTILHELFHVSGVADLPVFQESTTPAQEAAGEFETYCAERGADRRCETDVEDPRFARYPSSAPLRNADSYRMLVTTIGDVAWTAEAEPGARWVPTFGLGVGATLPTGDVTLAARVAWTPLGRGLHFITPGAVGLWMPGLGVVDRASPDADQPRAYAGGELGLRWVTGAGPVAGVFDLGAGAGAIFRRDETVDAGALVRASAGIRFGGPGFGGRVSADLSRLFDFALQNQREDGWILGGFLGLHWGGRSGAPR